MHVICRSSIKYSKYILLILITFNIVIGLPDLFNLVFFQRNELYTETSQKTIPKITYLIDSLLIQ